MPVKGYYHQLKNLFWINQFYHFVNSLFWNARLKPGAGPGCELRSPWPLCLRRFHWLSLQSLRNVVEMWTHGLPSEWLAVGHCAEQARTVFGPFLDISNRTNQSAKPQNRKKWFRTFLTEANNFLNRWHLRWIPTTFLNFKKITFLYCWIVSGDGIAHR